MAVLPELVPGFVRISVRLRPGSEFTPGEIARATGLAAEHIGNLSVSGGEAVLDVHSEHGRAARDHLRKLGPTELVQRCWQWLRIAIGRNHGLSMGQLRKIMQSADALPVGKIEINNTHTLVGILDDKMSGAVEHLAKLKINGFAARPTVLAKGPGSAAFVGSRQH